MFNLFQHAEPLLDPCHTPASWTMKCLAPLMFYCPNNTKVRTFISICLPFNQNTKQDFEKERQRSTHTRTLKAVAQKKIECSLT